jgi:hypothetical protein
MDFLSLSPKDHIHLIYAYLGIRELLSIGLTSKRFYDDSVRRKILANKLIDDYLYINDVHTILTDEYFPANRYYKELVDAYFERLKKISIQDLHFKSSHPGIVSVHKMYSTVHFKFDLQKKEYEIVIPFDFFVQAFLGLDEAVKKEIILNIFGYLLELWKVAEKSSKCIYNTKTLHRQVEDIDDTDGFEFVQLFLSLNHILIDIFIHETNTTRQFIVEQFNLIQTITHNCKYYYAVVYDYPECTYFSNDYDIIHFIRMMKISPVDILKIIDIGIFLKDQKWNLSHTYPPMNGFVLSTFIAEVFDDFVGGEDEMYTGIDEDRTLDGYAELIHEQLLNKSTDHALETLFYEVGFDYQRFKKVIQLRLNRWTA